MMNSERCQAIKLLTNRIGRKPCAFAPAVTLYAFVLRTAQDYDVCVFIFRVRDNFAEPNVVAVVLFEKQFFVRRCQILESFAHKFAKDNTLRYKQ